MTRFAYRSLRYCVLPLVFSLPLGACSRSDLSTISLESEKDHIPLTVEIAITPEQQRIGLQHRTHLPKGQGMLFIVNPTKQVSVWMKDTLIPLDVLFFNQAGYFVNGYSMIPCRKDQPCKGYYAKSPIAYALEVNAGLLDEYSFNNRWRLTSTNRLSYDQ